MEDQWQDSANLRSFIGGSIAIIRRVSIPVLPILRLVMGRAEASTSTLGVETPSSFHYLGVNIPLKFKWHCVRTFSLNH